MDIRVSTSTLRLSFLTALAVLAFGCGSGSTPVATLSGSTESSDADIDWIYADESTLLSGDGHALYIWTPFDSRGGVVLFRSIDADLQISGRTTIEGPNFSRRHQFPSACRGEDGLSFTWTDSVSYGHLEIGETRLDPSNVAASVGGADAAFQVNANDIGFQEMSSIACLSGGRYAMSWVQRCRAIHRDSSGVDDVPAPACDGEPADGWYLRIFESDGEPAGDAKLVREGSGDAVAPLAALDDGRFILVLPDSLQLRAADGVLIEERALEPRPYGLWSPSCVGKECVLTDGGGEVAVFDGDDLASLRTVAVHATEYPSADRQLVATMIAAACDTQALCLAVWTLESQSRSDPYDWTQTQYLGLFARPFDHRSGALGEEIRIGDSHASMSSVFVATVEPGVFVTTISGAQGLDVHRVDVR